MRPAGERSETGFVSRGRSSEDVEGWHEIVHRFAPYVHAVCVAHGLTEDDAEAVFDEVFTRMWTEISRLQDDDALRARVTVLTEEVAAAEAKTTASPGVLAALRDALNVHEAARGLPSSQRELLQRGVVDGQDDATIAGALDLGTDAVAAELQVARMRLRGRLRRRGINVQGETSKHHDRA
jgi:DNA-directed RNA polymerase specialized sigma24 family protein